MQEKFFIVPYFSEKDVWNLLDALEDKIYALKYNHIFFFSERTATYLRKNFKHLSVIECTTKGDTTNLEQFVIDFFEGGNHLYTAYKKQCKYLVIIPLTDNKITITLLSVIFDDTHYEVKENHLFFFQDAQQFCVFENNPYITCLRVLLEDFPDEIPLQIKMLKKMVELYCEDKYFLSHRFHHIPDLRRPEGFKIPFVDLSRT